MLILVTGATGFLGSHLMAALAHRPGCAAFGLARRPTSAGGPVADLTDPDAARAVLGECAPDVIAHCAASVPAGADSEACALAAEQNRRIDDAVFGHWRRSGCRLLYLSTTAVYGAPSGPSPEETPPDPRNAYALEKWRSEEAVRAWGGDHFILRVCAPYGPRQRTRTVLRIFIERALADADLEYHGRGMRTQAFTAAEDVVGAILAAASSAGRRETCNIAAQDPVSMRELAAKILEACPESRSRIRASGLPDPEEEYRGVFPAGKARRILGWTPAISLSQGVAAWVRILRAS
jgi:UDP-glucose 4-epimerase